MFLLGRWNTLMTDLPVRATRTAGQPADQTKNQSPDVRLQRQVTLAATLVDGRSSYPLASCSARRHGCRSLDGASSHSGRRTFITALAAKGVGVRGLASLAGHRSITTTQRYIDVNDAMKRAAVELVG
jgi:integrase